MGYDRTMSKSKRHSLSVVYATFNEEANLARSLDSIKDLADEIIVVDGSSEDKTREIAKKYQAKVIKTTNKPIFHINKQMAMDKASKDWTLQMDADEVVDKTMKKDIERILKQDPQDCAAGYWLKRKNYFLGTFLTKGGQYPDPVIRFYQTGQAHLPMKNVHEQMEVNGQVGWLEGHLLHYNSPDFSVYLRKANTYTTLTALEWHKNGRRTSWKMFLQMWFFKPLTTFILLYFRHKGVMDGFPGFVFALFSALHFPMAYAKLWEIEQNNQSAPEKK